MDIPPPPEPTTFTVAGVTYAIAYDATISMARANGIALVLTPVVFLGLLVVYRLLWATGGIHQDIFQLRYLPWLLLILVLSIIIHEGLHAVGFVLVGRVPLSAIKFGFSWQGLAPYAPCRVPLPISAYRLSVLLPGFVLGFLPALVGLLIGSFALLLYGAVMLVTAGGDLAVFLAVRSVPSGARVIDHPTAPGCHVLQDNGVNE